MDKKCGIYKITSPNNRIYIGQSVNIHKRFLRYKRLDCINQPILYNSFKKYNVENHSFEIIEECNIKELNDRERYWQEYYDVIGNKGLNCVLQETSTIKRELTKELKERKSKIIINLNLKKKENIYQYDKEGNLIKKWNNTSEIKINYPDINYEALNKCLNNKYKFWNTYGFIWKKDELLTKEQLDISKKIIEKSEKDKTIIQYDLNGNFVKEWKNQKEIFKVLNLQVSNCVSGKVSNTVGFIWKYKRDNFDIKNHKLDKICVRKTKHDYPIYQYNKKGEIIKIWTTFENPRDRVNAILCVLGKRNTFKNYVWSKNPLNLEEIESKFKVSSIPLAQYTLEGKFIKKWNSGNEAGRFFKMATAKFSKNEFTNKKGFLWKPLK